jgi:hypothetical protein
VPFGPTVSAATQSRPFSLISTMKTSVPGVAPWLFEYHRQYETIGSVAPAKSMKGE